MNTSLLVRSCLNKDLIELIYLSKTNNISHRIITAETISNGILTGYCHQKKQVRRFLIEQILSVSPVQQKQA
ncbi:hypothetical protein [Alkalicoccobacillus plakortidis]|uniref:Uncharacterized protein n=1 Tax=Alkalicoccobacillus plakortidis TaxID=444060 RepID=A0ABT0XNA0_9BACI|nr:hypothetical protein [Alkalicoccobacillus plakortidis]MCM2676724.1 hypothetical protein [Alkalicoccobacillus plakortidis]